MQPQKVHSQLKVLFVGGILILLVGAYFIGRSIWYANVKKKTALEATRDAAGIKNVPTISPVLLREKIRNKEPFVVVDIRPEEAYQAEHIIQSLSIPGGNLSSFVPEEKKSVVIVYSEADPAAIEVAKETLRKKKFSYFFLDGGFEAWKKESNQTLSFGDPASFVDQSKVTFITSKELKTLIESNPSNLFLLDIQSQEDFAKKHLKGAINIPLQELEKRSGEIPPARQVVVYGENELISFQGGVRLFDVNIFAAKTLEGNAPLTESSGLPLEP